MMLFSDQFKMSKLYFIMFKVRETFFFVEIHKICGCSKYRRNRTAVVIHQLTKYTYFCVSGYCTELDLNTVKFLKLC